jgi:hypothetical protein
MANLEPTFAMLMKNSPSEYNERFLPKPWRHYQSTAHCARIATQARLCH